MVLRTIKFRLIFLLIACNISSYVSAQGPWQQNSATWYYSYNNLAYVGYLKYEKQGDTLINNIYCDLLHRTSYGFNYIWGQFETFTDRVYTYKSNDTVFHFLNNQFKILFIFNSQPGDMWPVVVASSCQNGSFTVDSTSTIFINQDSLEIIHGRYIVDSPFGFSFYPNDQRW